MGWYGGFRPYVSVGQRQANAGREMAKLAKKGRVITPVKLDGNKIATTFWGKAWCENLESYSDFENRLPRGRTYVRNGSVVDLQIAPGKITAVVSGSELYDVQIKIKPLTKKIWDCVKGECGGKIGSLIELLQGRLAQGVMEVVTRKSTGLFPSPAEIDMDCSCPDWAGMCKHVAAVMYGIGARLDLKPELLFSLRQVDHLELITAAGIPAIATGSDADRQTIANDDLADVFGIELDTTATPVPTLPAKAEAAAATPKMRSRRKTATANPAPDKVVARRIKEIEKQSSKPQPAGGRSPRTKQKADAVKTTGRRKGNRSVAK